MAGYSPKTAGVFGLVLALGACAHAVPTPVHDARASELLRLQAELAQRDQLIAQLEGRLALAEAGQRQLRVELERAEATPTAAAAPPARDSVRIGRAAPPPEPAREIVESESESARPMLRLHNDRGTPRTYARNDANLTSSWTPPVTTERLTVVPLPGSRAKSAPMPPPPSVAPASDDLYTRGLDLLRRREFAEAQRELDAFVAKSPHDPRTGRAHFFRAELMYADRLYDRALAAYQQSLTSDPRGDKAPDAMLRSALCQLSLGARDQARATLASLRAKFPDSDAARKSAQVMQEDSG